MWRMMVVVVMVADVGKRQLAGDLFAFSRNEMKGEKHGKCRR
jgi:hypothetical protein